MKKTSKATFNECTCERCQDACRRKPGWFLPSEAENLAELMGMTLKDLFDKYLGVDWYVGFPDVFVLSPAVCSMSTGGMFSGDPQGICVFFNQATGKCAAHSEHKPIECKIYHHDDELRKRTPTHEDVARAWNTKENQQQIRDLLGEEPKSKSFLETLTNDFIWKKKRRGSAGNGRG